jgi:hypothetical protein
MKKLLAALAIMFLLGGCASIDFNDKASVAEKEVVKTDLIYPQVAPNDPAIVDALDDIFAASKDDGWSVLGFAADINNDTIMWLSNPEGICMCILVGFSTGDLIPFPSCEEGLDVWNECVDDGYCGATTGEVPQPDENQGV